MNNISGYDITEELFKSSNSLVYRGYRETDKQPVVLKMLKQSYPPPEKIAWFKREFEITRNLKLAGVVEAYSLETDQHRWVMVLEDFGGESLLRLGLIGQVATPKFLELAIQITDILGQVHQRHIIHKDVNPSNVVLNPVTRQLKLIDFGISTMLSRENPTLRNPNVLEGTLAYISPEQTGRMNRAMDYRTDFYSLGVTFYQLLTGQLPFATTDPMELVHAHIARQPSPPHTLKADVPQILSQIVLQLMAKNAEDRYQSAQGLKADLEECLRQWQTREDIDLFPLGRHDVSDRFQIPQKLYGREQEIKTLLAAFERVSPSPPLSPVQGTNGETSPQPLSPPKGGGEMMLVSGYPGIGKSALVQEIHKPITSQRGYFIAGKFDQLQRDTPYASLAQAFRALIRQLLTESESRIAAWREELLTAVGSNGQVIIKVVPEMELIIGPQPAAPDLPPVEAQNRFNLVFQNFIEVFTRPEHPLVLFLDDLQWADAASLQLLKLLMTAPASQHLFVIGAYRDNEVSAAHPLMLTLEEIKQAGGIVNQIALTPLDLPHLDQFIADTLYCAPQTARPLAELIQAKTNGNPFFLIEFLKSLYAEALLTFDYQQGSWGWDLERIQAQGITDNVVELMAGKVQKLGQETQQVLKLAACMGNQFDLQTLAIVHEKSPRQTAIDLWPAIVEGLVLPLGDAYKLMDLEVPGLAEEVMVEYKFAHDRIQQAAYSLIPEANKQVIHRQVGQLLLHATRTRPEEREQKIFDIVNQLNLGRLLIDRQSERDELAELNLKAGKKAKASAAYQPAFNYLQTGLKLLEEDSWQRQYDLTLELFVEGAEVAFLNTEFEEMDRLIELVQQHAARILDQVKVYEVLIQAHIARNNLLEAIQAALQILKLLGMEFPEEPDASDISASFQEVGAALAGQEIEDLSALPAMTDPSELAAMRILKAVNAASFLAAPQLFSLMILKQVSLSIQHGNADESAYAYANYGVMLTAMGDIESGYRFGKLALSLLERFNTRELKANIWFFAYAFSISWKEPIREILKHFLEGYQSGLETGNPEFAAYFLSVYVLYSYCIGKELTELEREMVLYNEIIGGMKQERTREFTELFRQSVLNLIGRSESPYRLIGERIDEDELLPRYLEVNDLNGLCHIYLHKLMVCYLFQQYGQAVESAIELEKNLVGYQGMFLTAVANFYISLAQLAMFSESTTVEQENILKMVAANQEKMQIWSEHAPMNFRHKFYLVEAERARVLGKDSEARDYYDRAIDLAQENEYLNEEALAYELAVRFYLERGQTRLAGYYLRDAHYAYQRWGATAKVKDLETRYPQFLAQAEARSRELPVLKTPTSEAGETASSTLDLISVFKASQAISSEIELGKLLTMLMKIIIENAGAQQGYLILEKKGQWVIEAEAHSEGEGITVLQSIPMATKEKLAVAIVNYVLRTRESVVLNDAAREGLFRQDPYVTQNQPRSILCMPLINQGKLNGILYLENNLTTGAFTPDRVELLSLLSGQAAISLENASLYTHQVELTRAANRFVPHEFLQFLNKDSLVDVKLGDHVQLDMTILVSDMQAFTTLTETMTPRENFEFINRYFQTVAPVIRKNHGSTGKYTGDGMMAFFPEKADDAVRAAAEIMQQLARYNLRRHELGQLPIRTGIGLHTGNVILGTVGEEGRMQGDVMSDAVNLTDRLEGLTRVYGASIVLSSETLSRLEDPTHFKFRFLGKVQVRGRQEAIPIFELFDGDPEEIAAIKLETKTEFEHGLSLYYEQRFADASLLFKYVLEHNPADKAAGLYLEWSAHYLAHGIPDDWTGVEVRLEK